MRKIYADIYTLVKKKNDINNFEKNIWPINQIKFQKFYSEVLIEYENLIKCQNHLVKDVVLADFKFYLNLIDYLHYYCAKLINKKKSIKNINFSKIIKRHKNLLIKKNLKINFENKLKLKTKKLIKNYLFSNISSKKVLVFGTRTENLIRYLKKKREKPIYDYFQLFLKGNRINKKYKSIEIKNYQIFFSKVENLVKKNFGIKINLVSVKKNWLKNIIFLYNDYLSILNSKYLKRFNKIYFTDDVQLYHRLISAAARRKGLITYKFDHGNNFYLKENKLNKFFLSNYSFNICGNINSHKILKKIYKSEKYLLINSNVKLHKIPFKKKIKKKINQTNKKIMLVGFPMTTYRYLGSEDLFWYNEFFLELEILKVLKLKGYKVLYKIHPSTLGWEFVFKDYVDEIIYDNFENCWNKSDLLIFSNIGSTTFTYSLSTNIPIVLFENKYNSKWNNGVFKYIKKRCVLINYSQKKKTSNFNKKEFLDKISSIKKVCNKFQLNENTSF